MMQSLVEQVHSTDQQARSVMPPLLDPSYLLPIRWTACFIDFAR
jgi:hypothetical protein